MPGFQRARSAEQRAIRRRAILHTAAAMLAERPAAEISLNELSRRACLAKSNVLRYFDSREAVLLELLDEAWGEWLGELAVELPTAVDPEASVSVRGEQLAAALARSVARRPVLCDLAGAQAAVLERNVSAEVAARFKRTSLARVGELAGLARGTVAELDEPSARTFAALAMMTIGAAWTHSRPAAPMVAACEADPEPAGLWSGFADLVREALAISLAGLLARAAGSRLTTGW
ncbi:TetR/AcrR family transcriptional regulator [Pseudonocardia lacus]|uniref:TetR/AcrR family transcriptional regulator n=1 Tax=Pseudonocardia lacus TaxID=2835865 RepID=UPI001BDC2423|nr:TetR family transcriptional regulator [Pseudonocardia lacus]